MRLILIFSCILLYLGTEKALACDFCNCYLGLNPHYKKNSIGLRYHSMSYTGSHMEEWQLQKLNYSKNDFWELRTVAELHAQYYPLQKLQLLLSFPYIYNSEGNTVGYIHHHGNDNNTSTTNTYQGIGDPMLIAHYQVFNRVSMDTAGNNYSHRLMAGGGIKFPFGNWKIAEGVADDERVHLPGSGSWDIIGSIVYLSKLGKIGMNTNLTYLLTAANSQSFSYGNRFNGNLVVYYQSTLKSVTVFPSAGAYYEQAAPDLANGYELLNSGGSILFAHAGLDLYFKKFAIINKDIK